jgi:hypothetical protein
MTVDVFAYVMFQGSVDAKKVETLPVLSEYICSNHKSKTENRAHFGWLLGGVVDGQIVYLVWLFVGKARGNVELMWVVNRDDH